MDPPKLTKSTFCGPLSLKFPTGDEIDREFPGPDLIFCVSILELNWIPPISETFIFFEDIDVSVGDVLKMSLPFESIITNLFDAMITSFSSVKYEIEMVKKGIKRYYLQYVLIILR